MDWLEEKKEKFIQYLQNAVLVRSLVCYLCITSLGALVLYLLTRNICATWFEVISNRLGEFSYWNLESGKVDIVTGIEKKYDLQIRMITIMYNYSLYVYMFAAYLIGGKLFFQKKLNPAIQAMSEVLNAINAGDYSREMDYRNQDEMGKLCRDMEYLRKALIQEKMRQWEQQEAQRKINAAFAHDMRTPLTVIKGYTEFLQKYIPKGKVSQELLLEKLETMRYQEERLLCFSNTMTTIQKLEKREIQCQWITLGKLKEQVQKAAAGVIQARQKEISLNLTGQEREKEIFADCECIQEVLENLLNNAMRYSEKKIEVTLETEEKELRIYVKDDGRGFSARALCMASEAYFSEEENSSEHFGIGLSICRILCENHNGTLRCLNSMEGGAVVAASFGIGIR